jgi:hypothetical protein
MYRIHRIFEDTLKNREDMSIIRTSDVTELHRLLIARWSEDMTAAFEQEHARIVQERKSSPPHVKFVEKQEEWWERFEYR